MLLDSYEVHRAGSARPSEKGLIEIDSPPAVPHSVNHHSRQDQGLFAPSVTDRSSRIDALPRRWSIETPAGVAIHDGARSIGWRALASAVDACSAMLAGAGVRPGDRV